MWRLRTTAVILVLTTPVRAQDAALRPLIRAGQEATFRLDYNGATECYQEIIRKNPTSPIGHGMMAIVEWGRLLRASSNLVLDDYATPTPFIEARAQKDTVVESTHFHQANDRLLEVTGAILKADSGNVLARYFEGVAYENLAAEAVLIRRSRGAAMNAGRKAARIHGQVLDLDPDFTDAYLSLAGVEFAKATAPWAFKFLLGLFFQSGDKDKAFQWLRKVSDEGIYRPLDAYVTLAFLNAWKGDPAVAVRILADLNRRFPENYLLDLNLAATYELQLKDLRKALDVYLNLERNLETKTSGMNRGDALFLIGRTHFRLQEFSKAVEILTQALASPASEQETHPLAHFYIASIHQQQGDSVRARRHYDEMMQIAESMQSLRPEFREAKREYRRLP